MRGGDHAVDDRLAVLGLAALEIARVGGRLDEVAFAVDVEEPRRLAADLAADEEARAGVDVALHQERAVAALRLAQRVADERARRRTSMSAFAQVERVVVARARAPRAC